MNKFLLSILYMSLIIITHSDAQSLKTFSGIYEDGEVQSGKATYTYYEDSKTREYVKQGPFRYHLILKSDAGNYFPLAISHRLLPKPAFIGKFNEKAYQATLDAVKYHVGYTLLLILLTWMFCFWINSRRDL